MVLLSLLFLQSVTKSGGFIRMVTQTDGVEIAQTLTEKLVAAGKPDVYLVGVAHIGSKDYYRGLQKLLDAQETVLFEGVTSKNKGPVPKKPDPSQPKSVYQVLGDAVGLDFQFADIEYNRPGWINSDLSMEELDRLNKAGGKGKPTQFDTVEKMLDPKSPETKMMTDFFKSASPSMREAIRIFLVEKLSDTDSALAKQMDASTYNIILTVRNQAIEKTFENTLASQKQPKSIAIFYGAAHQPGLEKDLAKRYGYRPASQQWFTFAKADRRKLDASGKSFLNTLGMLAKGF